MNIPSSWSSAELGDLVASIIGGGTPNKSDHRNFAGPIPFMTVKDLKGRFVSSTVDRISKSAVDSSATTVVPSDTLVVASRMSLGKIVRPTMPVAINQDLKALFLKDGVDKTFIEYCWRSKAQSIEAMGTGTTVKGIRLEQIRGLDVPLAPAAEQRRIAGKLDTVLARVDALKEGIDRVGPLLKRFRQSVLASATSGRLTEIWRRAADDQLCSGGDFLVETQRRKLEWAGQNPEHNETGRVLKRLQGFERGEESRNLPKSWVFASLEDVVLLVVDCHNKTAPYTSSGIPLVRTTNVRDGHFQWDELRYVDSATAAKWSRRCTPEPGDLIYTREAPMGGIAIIPPSTTLCLGQRTMLFRPVPGLMSAEFLRIVVMSPAFKAYAESQAVGTGVKHLRVGSVSELRVPVPSQAEQAEIVRRVELLFAYADRLEARLNTAQNAAERLTPSLLAKAFRGDLVPQDPNDEPASELLRRLRAVSKPVSAKRSSRRGQ